MIYTWKNNRFTLLHEPFHLFALGQWFSKPFFPLGSAGVKASAPWDFQSLRAWFKKKEKPSPDRATILRPLWWESWSYICEATQRSKVSDSTGAKCCCAYLSSGRLFFWRKDGVGPTAFMVKYVINIPTFIIIFALLHRLYFLPCLLSTVIFLGYWWFFWFLCFECMIFVVSETLVKIGIKSFRASIVSHLSCVAVPHLRTAVLI